MVTNSGARILLVDDEKRILQTFSMLLGDLGYPVAAASNAEDALELVRSKTFDIVFLDQFLRTTTGLELMRQMSSISPDLYYVIMTADGNTDLAVESLKTGASDFISKPFFVADLIRSIDYVNKKRELDRQRKEMFLVLERQIEEKTEELKKVCFSMLSSLSQAMEKKDIGTYGHSQRVSHYSMVIASSLVLDKKERDDLLAAAVLHDVGKIGISDVILGKPGPLTEQEMEVVRDHPSKGVEILKPIRQFKSILPAILHHHENYDGSGYPYGLAGENIPMLARIIAVADSYDAILSVRPYRAAGSHDKAIEELRQCAGKQFDPLIVDAFDRSGVESICSLKQTDYLGPTHTFDLRMIG
jgi:putative two-component system response regulator